MLKDVENIKDISEKGMQAERYVKRGLKIHVNTERFFFALPVSFLPFLHFNKAYYYYCPFFFYYYIKKGML